MERKAVPMALSLLLNKISLSRQVPIIYSSVKLFLGPPKNKLRNGMRAKEKNELVSQGFSHPICQATLKTPFFH